MSDTKVEHIVEHIKDERDELNLRKVEKLTNKKKKERELRLTKKELEEFRSLEIEAASKGKEDLVRDARNRIKESQNRITELQEEIEIADEKIGEITRDIETIENELEMYNSN